MKRFALLAMVSLALSACAKTPSSGPSHDPASANDGARVYITNCSSCHQLDGTGIPGAFPALAGNAFVTGPPGPVIKIVKFGTAKMPAWSGTISDEDIAAVVNYIRNTWRSRASMVSAADVANVTAAK